MLTFELQGKTPSQRLPKTTEKRHTMARVLLVFGFFSWAFITEQARAAKPLQTPVASYPLQCDETFSCPESLRPRVAFWVEV